MASGKPNGRYTGEFKQEVVETMRKEKLGARETAERFGILHQRVLVWERTYLEEGASGLYVERRGRAGALDGAKKGRPPKMDKQIEEDLIAENQRLRAENAYLKNLQALVLEDERHQRKKRR
jgi:transposase-like protein